MIVWYMAIYVLALHLVADFFLQWREMSLKKSQKIWWLVGHAGIHFVVFYAGLSFVIPNWQAVLVALFNAILHAVVDWNIWNGYRVFVLKFRSDLMKEYKFWEDSLFYTTIGIDQFLHLSLLFSIWTFVEWML